MVMMEDTPAHAPDHGPMPPHQRGQGWLFTAVEVFVQQLLVSQPRAVAQQLRAAQAVNEIIHRAGRHVLFPWGLVFPYLLLPAEGGFDTTFSSRPPSRLLATGCVLN